MKKRWKEYMGILLIITLVLGLMPEMSLTVHADGNPVPVTIKAKDQERDNIISSPEYTEVEGLMDGHTLYAVQIDFDAQSGRVFPSAAVIHNGEGVDVTEQYNITYEPGTATGADRIYFTVRFVVKNGAWNNGKTTDKVVTLSRRKDEDLLLVLREEDIPQAGQRPDSGFAEGVWDAVPSDDWAISRDLTYTYSYIQNPLAEITRMPSRNDSIYDGTAQKLLKNDGEASGGTLQYALGTVAAPTDTFSNDICTGTDAGTYYVWVKAAGDANHSDCTAQRVRVDISPAWLDLQPANGNWIYDGQEHTAPEVTVKEGTQLYGEDTLVATATGSVKNVEDTAIANNTVAPGYKVMRGNEDVTANYNIWCYKGNLTVTKRDVRLTSESGEKAYDGEALTKPGVSVSGSGFVEGEVNNIRATGSVTTVEQGEVMNTITWTPGASFNENNYEITKSEGKLRITQANLDMSALKVKPLTYNGHEQVLVETGSITGGEVYYALGESEVVAPDTSDYTASVPKATEAGTYYVWFKAKGDSNHTDFEPECLTVKINKALLTITANDQTYIYNGETYGPGDTVYDEPTEIAREVKVDGLQEGDVLTSIAIDGQGKEVGTYDLVPSIAMVNGESATKNYDVAYVKGTLTIASAPTTKNYGTILSKMTSKGKNSLVLTWNKMDGVEGYDIYFAQCNHNEKHGCKKIKTIKGNKTCKWTKSGLKKSTSYKAYVKAYVIKDGKKTYVKTSLTVHAYTSGGSSKYTNAKGVTVKKTSVSLKTGKTYNIKASVTKLQKGKKLMPKGHAAKLRYISSDKEIATVNKSGKITAKRNGNCKIYVIAVNGASKAVKVTVR
ncbi:MAG: Ig-like domain-containing protein [Lachnospiraceae bacterium]|nr:Ig-like domain-containing protein [Lachnospiraceae bacterium]